ncbi:MAG: type II secretion system F family protein, partial [Eubacteriales bacterium]
MIIAIMISIFFLSVLIAGQLIYRVTWKQRRLEQRLKTNMSEHLTTQGSGERPVLAIRTRQWIKAASLPSSILSRRSLDRVQSYLVKAGVPLKPEEMITFIFVCGLVLSGLGWLVFRHILVGVVLGILGLFTPVIWVSFKNNRRTNRLESQLLDAVTLMANSLRGGHSFMQALELVSRETSPPLSEELGKVVRETKIGISSEEALNNLNTRV